MTNVYFVGAGPGNPKLITVRGLELLKLADVILYDRLVNPLILQEAKAEAEIIYCGKSPTNDQHTQEDINELIVKKAKAGKTVVRLKGGDPAIFGRVGEEALVLKQHHINYEIVPGITSGIGAAIYAGIPLTHRNVSSSFTIVAGQKKEGNRNIHWQGLATGSNTLAFYMGIKNLSMISNQLMKHGKSPTTPVAVIQWGTTGRQKVVEGTLNTIVSVVQENQIENPAIILVGDVVSFRHGIQWYEQQNPLMGKKILIPNCSDELKKMLNKEGAEVLTYPTIPTANGTKLHPPTVEVLKRIIAIDRFDSLVFTSPKAVNLFETHLQRDGYHVRDIVQNTKVLCIGEETMIEAVSKKISIKSYISDINVDAIKIFHT